jgi:hypothetical protein
MSDERDVTPIELGYLFDFELPDDFSQRDGMSRNGTP